MDDRIAMLITILSAMGIVGWLLNGWIARRPMAVEAAGRDGLDAARQVELLSNENQGLKGQMGRLEERIAVLERIATDPSERTARAIEQLR